jgi:hypothetical protein
VRSKTASASQVLLDPATFPGHQKFDGPGLLESFALQGRVMTRASVARQYSFVLRESVFSMTSGSYDIYSHPDGRTIHIYYIIPQDQKYWWIVNTPDSTSETGNTIDELMRLLKSIYYEADPSPVLVPPSMFVTA